jgi:hypothetical protein
VELDKAAAARLARVLEGQQAHLLGLAALFKVPANLVDRNVDGQVALEEGGR